MTPSCDLSKKSHDLAQASRMNARFWLLQEDQLWWCRVIDQPNKEKNQTNASGCRRGRQEQPSLDPEIDPPGVRSRRGDEDLLKAEYVLTRGVLNQFELFAISP